MLLEALLCEYFCIVTDNIRLAVAVDLACGSVSIFDTI